MNHTKGSAAKSFCPGFKKSAGPGFAVTVLFMLAATSFSCSAGEETVEIRINGKLFTVEVADSQEERSRGLMYRKSLPGDRGMLFIFPHDQQLSFWMKNTEIPLSVGYISKDGIIKEIHDLVPHSEQPVHSSHSVRFALELNRGSFRNAGIRVGDKIEGLPPETGF